MQGVRPWKSTLIGVWREKPLRVYDAQAKTEVVSAKGQLVLGKTTKFDIGDAAKYTVKAETELPRAIVDYKIRPGQL